MTLMFFKGIDLVGDALVLKVDEPPPDPDRFFRPQAVTNLWRGALDSVRIRHPDPRVTVEPIVNWSYNTDIPVMEMIFIVHNLVDTGDASNILPPFHHIARPWGWPGMQVARKYLSAAWSIYLLHEGQELVTLRDTQYGYRGFRLSTSAAARAKGEYDIVSKIAEIPVIDSHNRYGVSQKALANTHDFAATLDWGLGVGQGQGYLDAHAGIAKVELQNEIDFVAGRVGRWE